MKLIHHQPVMKDHEASSTFAAQDGFLALSLPVFTIRPGNVPVSNWRFYLYPGHQGAFLTVSFSSTCATPPPSAAVTGFWGG